MTEVAVHISMSLDGFVAGPDPSDEEPLGRGGELLHEWVIGVRAWRESHGLEGGETNLDDELQREEIESVGSTIMGRRMFSGGSGPWESDSRANGWWGEEPPFHHPVFVLTSHAREPLELEGTTFHFVTDGIESALEQARSAAGGKNVRVSGGGNAIQQYVAAGLVDVLDVHVAPVLLGGGVRLFGDDLASAPRRLALTRVLESPVGAAHLRYTLSG